MHPRHFRVKPEERWPLAVVSLFSRRYLVAWVKSLSPTTNRRSSLSATTPHLAQLPIHLPLASYVSVRGITYSRCRPSEDPSARRCARPPPGTHMRRARRPTQRPSRTCASTATQRCCSRASPASREREWHLCSLCVQWTALTEGQFPRPAGHRVRYAPDLAPGPVASTSPIDAEI